MKVLAIGAHFDDVEIGCGGALLRHVGRGDRVVILVVTDSSFTAPDGRVVRTAEAARCEGRRSADIIGADLICAGFRTNNTLYDERLVLAMRELIDREDFDMVYTHFSGDVHLDHANIARAALSAARHVPSLLMYRSNWYAGSETFQGRILIDISAVFDRKLDLLRCYGSEFERRGRDWIDFVQSENKQAGLMAGVSWAEAFQPVRFRWQP